MDLVSVGFFGLWSPAGVALARRAVLEAALLESVRDEAVSARILATGAIPRALGASEFARFLAGEVARLGGLVRATGMRAD